MKRLWRLLRITLFLTNAFVHVYVLAAGRVADPKLWLLLTCAVLTTLFCSLRHAVAALNE